MSKYKRKCWQCSNIIEGEDYRRKYRRIYCDDCYHEEFEVTCPLCEDYYEGHKPIKETYLYIHKEIQDIKPGFYQCIDFPVYISDGFDTDIQKDNIELISDKTVEWVDNDDMTAAFICEDCFKKNTKEGVRHV